MDKDRLIRLIVGYADLKWAGHDLAASNLFDEILLMLGASYLDEQIVRKTLSQQQLLYDLGEQNRG